MSKRFKYSVIQKLASRLARKEGKKSRVKIGDIREILRLLALEMRDDMNVQWNLWAYSESIKPKPKHLPKDIVMTFSMLKKTKPK